jgi:DNA mismatch repair protein MutS2
MKVDFFKSSINLSTAESLGWNKFLEICSESLCLKHEPLEYSLFPFLESQGQIKSSQEIIQSFLENNNLLDNYSLKLKKISPYLSLKTINLCLKSGQVLSYRDLNGICLALETLRLLIPDFDLLKLNSLNYDAHELQNFINRHTFKIRSFILEDFQFNLKDDHKLRSLVERKQEIIKNIGEKTKYYLRSNNKITSSLSSLDFFDGNYLLPISANEYQSDFGQIIKRSNTGNTFYVNLVCFSALNNELNQVENSIEKHIYIFEKLLTEFLRNDSHYFEQILSLIFEVDKYLAKTKVSQSLGLTKPSHDGNFSFNIKSMFHPFVEEYVRNSLTFPKQKQVFLITGSNYGGKSVYLKSIAFCCLLNQSGFYLPAENSQLPHISKLFYFSGDLQDLEKSESTFSAESNYYLAMLKELDENSVIFFDEIFSSTSSLEGSALAYALIIYISQKFKKVKIFVTTHHETLKEFLSSVETCSFGSFTINPSNGLPNFKLVPDKIESSRALDTFSRIFSDFDDLNQLINSAKAISQIDIIPSEAPSFDFTTLDDKNKEIEQLKLEVEKLKEDFYFYKSEKETFKIKKSQNIKSPISTVKKINELEKSIEKKLHDLDPADQLKLGDTYYSSSMNTNVKLLEIKKDHLLVQKKSFRLKIPIADLHKTKAHADKNQSNISTFSFESEPKLKIDGRGMRLDEFIAEVETQMNHLLTENIPFLEVVHGHGSGVLKNWLFDMIKNNPEIEIEKREDGNDGATTIKLSK